VYRRSVQAGCNEVTNRHVNSLACWKFRGPGSSGRSYFKWGGGEESTSSATFWLFTITKWRVLVDSGTKSDGPKRILCKVRTVALGRRFRRQWDYV